MGAQFVACMEDVLDLYAQPYDPAKPTVCFDETSKQLIGETRPAWPARPGQVARYDYEMNAAARATCLCFSSPWPAGGISR